MSLKQQNAVLAVLVTRVKTKKKTCSRASFDFKKRIAGIFRQFVFYGVILVKFIKYGVIERGY